MFSVQMPSQIVVAAAGLALGYGTRWNHIGRSKSYVREELTQYVRLIFDKFYFTVF
jgi:hypothetical protein